MVKCVRVCWQVTWIVGLLTTVSVGQVPTYSLEAAEINSAPITGEPLSHITVLPGDVVTAEVYIRDWSPSGEDLAGFQAQMDSSTYASGPHGSIQPVDYETTQKTRSGNKENCFIDKAHAKFVHGDYEYLPLVDHRSQGYRWASLILGGEKGPINAQDGVKYYCATLKLQVSEDAQGTFTIALMEGANQSGLRDSSGRPILPVEFEALTIVVQPDLAKVIAGLNGDADDTPKHQIDIDGSGEHGAADALKVISMINGTP